MRLTDSKLIASISRFSPAGANSNSRKRPTQHFGVSEKRRPASRAGTDRLELGKKVLPAAIAIYRSVESQVEPQFRLSFRKIIQEQVDSGYLPAYALDGLDELKEALPAIKPKKIVGQAMGFVVNTREGPRVLTARHVVRPRSIAFRLPFKRELKEFDYNKPSAIKIPLQLSKESILLGKPVIGTNARQSALVELVLDTRVNSDNEAQSELSDFAVLKGKSREDDAILKSLAALSMNENLADIHTGLPVFAASFRNKKGVLIPGAIGENGIWPINGMSLTEAEDYTDIDHTIATEECDSGCAIVNPEGEVVGIHKGGFSISKNSYRQVGGYALSALTMCQRLRHWGKDPQPH